MKKSLVALAAFAVAGGVYAQSSVTLSGTIKSGVAHTKYSGAGATGSGLSVADGSSQFHIKGTEDLGGGLKAFFQIDTRFRADESAAATQASGNTFVGLSGGLGAIQLGKMDTHYCKGSDQHGARATALQASSCALLGYVGTATAPIANTSRSQNMIRYTTPNFSGFTGQLNYSTNFQGADGAPGDTGKGRAISAGLDYGNGPVKAGLSIWNAKQENQTTGAAAAVPLGNQKAYTLYGDYNFGVATVGLTYDNSEVNAGAVGGADAKAKRTAWSIPVTVPLGAGTFLFTYTKAGDVKVNGTTATDTGASQFSLGYDYALSKRTSLGVSYAKINNKANAGYALYTQAALNGTPNNTVGQDASQLYVGIRHAF